MTTNHPLEHRDHGSVAAAKAPTERFATAQLEILDHLMARGQMVAAQQPSASHWSAEMRLVAAVLASALVEVRDHHADPHYRRRVQEDLEWIHGDDVEWPFSFVRLCFLMDLDVSWVRESVARWMRAPQASGRQRSPFRHAA